MEAIARQEMLTFAQDVTEIIGTGKVDLGFKAMIHTLAVSFSLVNMPRLKTPADAAM